MRGQARALTPSGRVIAWVGGLTVAVGALFASWPEAQQGSSSRLNKIIDQFEKGEPALAGDHWRIVSLEHNPFLVDNLETFLNELEAEGASRPRLTPIVRIPYEADQDFHHVVKQILDAGAMGIVLPQVKTATEVTKLVRSMRYPPQRGARHPEPRGRRGWGPTVATRL